MYKNIYTLTLFFLFIILICCLYYIDMSYNKMNMMFKLNQVIHKLNFVLDENIKLKKIVKKYYDKLVEYEKMEAETNKTMGDWVKSYDYIDEELKKLNQREKDLNVILTQAQLNKLTQDVEGIEEEYDELGGVNV